MKQNLETLPASPALVSRFLDIRERPEINPKKDDFKDVFSDEQSRKHAFWEAKKAFEFIFERATFLRHLEQKPNKESFIYLKRVRSFGLILKSLYFFVNSSHKCTEKLSKFLYFLGQYNDSYNIAPSEENKKEIINNIDVIDLSINFCNTSEFRGYATGVLSEIEKLLQEKIFPVKKFHVLRIKIRSLANLTQTLAVENYGGSLHWLFYSLDMLSREMGKHHKKLVQKGLRGEINYDKSMVEIEPHIALEFNRIKPFIEKVCGLK
ncbi:hypothetical protein A3H53_01980 [Candidatus Nomurabacteria bacterium RIFCSPLOWO2_02_FULL_40_10]|uniref:CHAD domain-containing protein n=2 Tax=Candidatus Nomuraibacteriota TaxID=1752729 RepID=A0A1F6XW68_9BACT|nr:MAG: hypothetical protein A2642_00485 [Candidatus Nomurabacteria bacterium RIFCSPHIGHO2_01_FULL_39_10]OGI98362.1 MAG: hypothetical protein A3H53_01980 [Candidatus Nomurabacteria bacterium RIFCSPLOWO2_02_FULL_40_10]